MRLFPTTRCSRASPTKTRASASSRRSTGKRPFRSTRWATGSTSSCAAVKPRRWKNEMSLYATGNQTVGPYLHIGLTWLTTTNIAPKGVAGERVSVQGRLLDGDGAPVNDGMIEIWQANAEGKYPHPEDKQKKPLEKNFRGF